MKTIHQILFIALASLLLSCSAEGEKKKQKILVASKGLPSELLLVVDKDIWLSDLQDSIKGIVECQVPGLMQAENMFRLTRVFSRDYTARFYTFHTKLFIQIDPTLSAPVTGTRKNVSAKPQLELVVVAPSIEQLRKYLVLNGTRIRDILADSQIEIRTELLKRKYSKKVSDDLRQVLGMSIRVPDKLIATKKADNFLWGGTNTQQKDQNIVVYTYDWHGEDVYNLDMFVAKRDSVMQRNIPGERPDQWMVTVVEGGKPLVIGRPRQLNGRQVYEVRGLWEMRNGALGGPFISIARIDTTSQKVIVGEGFVYSPSTEKRDLLREMEAALWTLK